MASLPTPARSTSREDSGPDGREQPRTASSNGVASLPAPLEAGLPLTALAPMQNVTDLAFMEVIAEYGAPDYFFTEYFRAHPQSHPEKHILRSITENPTGRPVFAQLIGDDPQHLTRTARALREYPIAGIDLNMGCPAPLVYKKNAGGGLLRDPDKIDEVLGALRDAVPGLFTVKMRIGFDSTEHFARVLALLDKHRVDLLSLHGRTVKEMYRSQVHYDRIAQAVESVRCPVLANGEITSAARATSVLAETRAAGVMLGRHAIRNPWIFRQCRAKFRGEAVTPVLLADVREYIERLYRATLREDATERGHVQKMKRYLNFIGLSVDAEGAFLHAVRRVESEAQLFEVCDRHLLAEPARLFASEPYPGLVAREKSEAPAQTCDWKSPC
jgi:tRNA-dihydrouridine synthase B